MTGWDVLNNIMNVFPPIAMILLVFAAGVVFIVGFSRYGINFIKYSFKQTALDASLEKRFDDLGARIDGLHNEICGLRTEFKTELDMIKGNHFGHLKNYLGILNGVLLDKKIIDNETKARLDNELRSM
jgi:hypothetical protein